MVLRASTWVFPPQTGSWSIQPFLRSSHLCPTLHVPADRQDTHTHTLTHGIRSVAIGCIPHLRASSCMRCCHWWSACSTLQSIVLPCIVRLSCRSANSTNMHARHVADSHVRDTPDHLNDTFKWSESRYNVSWHLRKTSNTSDLTWHVSVIHHITSHGEYRSRPPKAFVSEK